MRVWTNERTRTSAVARVWFVWLLVWLRGSMPEKWNFRERDRVSSIRLFAKPGGGGGQNPPLFSRSLFSSVRWRFFARLRFAYRASFYIVYVYATVHLSWREWKNDCERERQTSNEWSYVCLKERDRERENERERETRMSARVNERGRRGCVGRMRERQTAKHCAPIYVYLYIGSFSSELYRCFLQSSFFFFSAMFFLWSLLLIIIVIEMYFLLALDFVPLFLYENHFTLGRVRIH